MQTEPPTEPGPGVGPYLTFQTNLCYPSNSGGEGAAASCHGCRAGPAPPLVADPPVLVPAQVRPAGPLSSAPEVHHVKVLSR